ncbi:hypothetical protein CR513_56117, partial [Mucuna pruriens]
MAHMGNMLEIAWKINFQEETRYENKFGGDVHAFQASNTGPERQSPSESLTFTKEQIEHLSKLFQSHSVGNSNPSCSIAQSGMLESFKCDVWQVSKHHCASFLPINSKNVAAFDLIYSNVWGPVIESCIGARWFVTFIDDRTRVTWIYLMKHKSKACQIFNFFRLVKNQFGKSIKRIRSNNSIEYVNLEFSKFVIDQRIIHELTCVNTPQQNGVA